MTQQADRIQAETVRCHGQVSSGVLGSDITLAVEIISVARRISGRSAFMLLTQAAAESDVCLGDVAGAVVGSHRASLQ